MYSTKPIGINTKDNDRTVADGFLQESINLQIRDGAMRPIPERVISNIRVTQYKDIILHKVGDENTVNVLGFKWFTPTYLAKNLAFNLGGDLDATQYLYWFGTITDGVYAEITPVNLGLAKTAGLSFTILNGMLYFMGDGSSTAEQYYYQYQFNEITGAYESSDMYAWKSLVPFYPSPFSFEISAPKSSNNVFTLCGVVCTRFALVLKSGEIVLHSPVYAYVLCGLNRSSDVIPKGTPIDNIHTIINLNFEFLDNNLFDDEISAINIYATIPYYEYELTKSYTGEDAKDELLTSKSAISEIQKQAEQPFYLVKTIDKPSNTNLLLAVGQLDADIDIPEDTYRLDIATIATGEIMPVDNFSYHKIYGHITASNGRLVVDNPITVLGEGHNRALALESNNSHVGFILDTEDGRIESASYIIDKSFIYSTYLYSRGVLSYPDSRATVIGGTEVLEGGIINSSINAGGIDYLVNDVLSVSGGDDNAEIVATAIVGKIYDSEINIGGAGYLVNDTVTILSGSGDATLTVTEVAAGVVTDYDIEFEGTSGYAIGNAIETSGGTGTGLKLNILAVKGAITAYSWQDKGSGYSVASGVATTVSPIGGSGFLLNILSVGDGKIKLMNLKKNPLHNMACAFNINRVSLNSATVSADSTDVTAQMNYGSYFEYAGPSELSIYPSSDKAKYSSNNRLQFSAPGEFSVWPAINSYRIGEGRIIGVGSNVVNISSTDVIAPLIVGTTDGIYTINIDPSGNTLVSSITRAVNMPYVSRETLQISDQLLFISDKGLYAFNNGDPVNLTKPFFPDQGDGDYGPANNVLANYNRLVERYFNFSGNPYLLDDIVTYLKGCLMAYDERRNSVWCSNPDYNFSLVYDIENRIWSFCTLVFKERIELFGTITAETEDIYSRYLLRQNDLIQNNLLVHSGEDMDAEVSFHLLTRPIKFQDISAYKKIERMFVRCELIRGSSDGFFTFGIWGKQDLNKRKTGIPIKAIIGDGSAGFPDDVRQDIPAGMHRGKYKSVTLLLGGKVLPESSIDGFDFEAYLVHEKKLR